MIGTQPQVNKNYTIQYSIKTRKDKILNKQMQLRQNVVFQAEEVELNYILLLVVWVLFYFIC